MRSVEVTLPVLLASCTHSHEPAADSSTSCADLDYAGTESDAAATPRDDEEAEWAAVCADGVLATQATYDRVQQDLAAMRAAYPDLLHDSYVNWPGDSIELDIGSGSRFDVDRFDCLNSYYHAAGSTEDGPLTYRVDFDGRFNTDLLQSEYRNLAGASSTSDPRDEPASEYPWLGSPASVCAGEVVPGPGDGSWSYLLFWWCRTDDPIHDTGDMIVDDGILSDALDFSSSAPGAVTLQHHWTNPDQSSTNFNAPMWAGDVRCVSGIFGFLD